MGSHTHTELRLNGEYKPLPHNLYARKEWEHRGGGGVYAVFDDHSVEIHVQTPGRDRTPPHRNMHVIYTYSPPPEVIVPEQRLEIPIHQELISNATGGFYSSISSAVDVHPGTGRSDARMTVAEPHPLAGYLGVAFGDPAGSQGHLLQTSGNYVFTREAWPAGRSGSEQRMDISFGTRSTMGGTVVIRYHYAWQPISEDTGNHTGWQQASDDGLDPYYAADESLEDVVLRLESDVQRAIEGGSAHPAFLDDLEGYLAELHEIIARMRAEEWGHWDPDNDVDASLASLETHEARGVVFNMRLAPAATFPTRTNDAGEATVDTDFWIGETSVTYELWYTVRQWALENGYSFANAGREGSHGNTGRAPSAQRQEPVTEVNWRDSIVWANALSEILGYDPVYTHEGNVIKDPTDRVVQEDTDGFRLPTSEEWELAARYQGNDSSHGAISLDGLWWTPGNYASGATADDGTTAATQEVAWYRENSGSTQTVGLKRANALGLYDMSGNVQEWCFPLSPGVRGSRMRRGGSWNSSSSHLQVGNYGGGHPSQTRDDVGFRLVRTQF